MVAEGGKIIADLIHDIDQIGACGQCADGLALNGVAAVNKCDIVVEFLHLRLVCRDAGIAKIVGDAAVRVVSVQDDNVVGLFPRRECCGHKPQQHDCRQQKCDQFLHSILPLHDARSKRSRVVYAYYTTNSGRQLFANV